MKWWSEGKEKWEYMSWVDSFFSFSFFSFRINFEFLCSYVELMSLLTLIVFYGNSYESYWPVLYINIWLKRTIQYCMCYISVHRRSIFQKNSYLNVHGPFNGFTFLKNLLFWWKSSCLLYLIILRRNCNR